MLVFQSTQDVDPMLSLLQASHWVYWDEPQRVNEEILKFLSPTATS
jgi:pimeloyl-ACP methyl ester carboxylesterase